VLAKTQDNEEITERVAACDIGKAELVCCVRVPDEDHRGKRLQEVEASPTMTRALLGMADRLACVGVTRVVMEATSDCWKPVFYLLEAAGLETWLVKPRTSSTCRGGRRLASWIASGCARSPGGR
jgi:transposase